MSTAIKLCECGCGQPAPIAKSTNTKAGAIKGQPQRFIRWHSNTKGKHAYSIAYADPYPLLVRKDGNPDGRMRRRKHASKKEAQRIRSGSYYKSKAQEKLIRRHGITPKHYDELAKAQDYGCAICGGFSTPKKNEEWREWQIDHDHGCCSGSRSCGKCVRGLLCEKCNLMLGCALDSVEILRAAIVYLMNSRRRQ